MIKSAASVVALTLLVSCATAPSPSHDLSPPPTASDSATPSPSPTATVAVAVPEPGQPYDADEILDLMRASRRPGGVPDEMETRELAERVAESVWTIDGEPWDTVSIGGSCGPVRCTLEVGGARTGSAGEDLWTFEVVPGVDQVSVIGQELSSLPQVTVRELDRMAREAAPGLARRDLLLVAARWLPPPDEGLFILSYRTGNEEGACEVDLEVNATSRETRELEPRSC